MTLAAGLCHAGSGQLDMTSLTTSTALAVLRQAAADQRAGIAHIPRDRVLAGAMALDQLTPLATRWLGGLILAAREMSPRSRRAPDLPAGLSDEDQLAFETDLLAMVLVDGSDPRPIIPPRSGGR